MQSKLRFLFCFFFLPITFSFAYPDTLILDKSVYQSGDTIQVQFDFAAPGMLFSNRGGCSDGPEYIVVHEQDPNHNMQVVHCDYLLLENYYIPKGNFELVVYEPGTYHIQVFFTTDQPIATQNPRIYEYTSTSFEVR